MARGFDERVGSTSQLLALARIDLLLRTDQRQLHHHVVLDREVRNPAIARVGNVRDVAPDAAELRQSGRARRQALARSTNETKKVGMP